MDGTANWWRGAVIYQIYPRSFKDSNGDGVGDLPGIAEKMGYLADLGVDAIWISPFFTSPMRDFGYDVSDYENVDPVFGTLADFDALIAAAHAAGIRVLIDLVVSHTSDRHPWFVESASSRDNDKSDWYTWADPRPDGTPPCNWLSHFGGSAWTWSPVRRQYYFHNFLAEQPDLNYHNPAVREAVKNVFRFWLDRGVDGFRLDTVNMYYQDARLRDNPSCPPDKRLSDYEPYDYQLHLYDKSRPENLAFLEELRGLLDSYSGRTLVGEIGGDPDSVAPLLTSYTEEGRRLHMAYVFDLFYTDFAAAAMSDEIRRLAALTEKGWICWSFSNHDSVRMLSRWGIHDHAERAAPMLTALLLSLRGSSCMYEGEELGLPEAEIPFELIQDPHGKTMWPEYKGRDGCRTPMPWEKHDVNAGFSPGTPWLPIPEEHRALAVDAQEADAESVLNRCRRFIHWRRGVPELRVGGMRVLEGGGDVLAVIRDGDDREILAVFNMSPREINWPLPPGNWTALEGHGFGGAIANGRVVLGGFDCFFGSATILKETQS